VKVTQVKDSHPDGTLRDDFRLPPYYIASMNMGNG